MAADLKVDPEALKFYNTLKSYARGSRTIDLNLDALRQMNIRLSGIFVAHIIELKEAGLIRYHVNDIPSIELL